MQTGVVFPQTELGADPGAVRAYAQAAEDLGYRHILVYDHVLGADPTNREGWRGYTKDEMFHEPFVLFGYLSGITRQMELVTGVIILPQRQTALVAKQAAEVDVLNEGRFRLGVGVGWNQVEYEALGENFHNRGKRVEEQVELMRRLWTEQVVSFKGRWHQVTEAGLNPLPVQRPIPVWMGGTADVLLRRAARMADGWFPQMPPNDTGREAVERLRKYTQEAGRDPLSIGVEARITIAGKNPDEWADEFEGWKALGATHVGVNTMSAGLKSPDEHIEAIRRFKEAVGD